MELNGDRMPVWKSHDKIRIHWLTVLVVVDIAYGLLTAFGPANSASQQVMRNVLPIATPLWGCALALAATFIWFGFSITGGLLGSGCWLALLLASFAAIERGTAPSWAGPAIIGGWAWFHLLITYEVSSELDLARERKQRA